MKIYILYEGKRSKKYKTIYTTEKDKWENIEKLATQIMGNKPHYYRQWVKEHKTYIDFGSHNKYIVVDNTSLKQ